ncbi:aldehyde dehydrogenase family protein [Lacipirellula limnantheis]|uniref:Aldehyde dehydrogenase family protein n=1 Tax=Lacipirellula limnantheis TaxID=2528024 RepID=A0A517U4N0_9BACT|nr:aldehyde dehydrogenase family protein [Lacipirellula limnantheis]QDT75510.1 Aldehyde dehydrogenase family protein [Lacipirellula limnantheis]
MANESSMMAKSPPDTSTAAVDQALADLRLGARRLVDASLAERIGWSEDCLRSLAAVAHDWVEAACRAKRIPPGSAARAEEILVGPVSVARYLRLIIATLAELRTRPEPRLPGQPRLLHGQLRVPTFPTRELYDALLFRGVIAETWLQPDATPEQLCGDAPARLARRTTPPPQIALVLGAGNVSAIPATDALTKILQGDAAVLLKMNPVNDYLGPYFEQSFAPLIAAGVLRIVYGGADVGAYAVHHPQVDAVHITGSTASHDAIVWGADPAERQRRQLANDPLVTKPVTSELGNVTPWAIVPGAYSNAQLQSQAESIAASIANNASFNCIATKMVITSRHWPQRGQFLDLISSILASIPPRYAYYPGAPERFAEFGGGAAPPDEQGRLPWLLRRDVTPDSEPILFERESFVCVVGETALDAGAPLEFLDHAVDFMNDQLWGTLAAGLTVPDDLRRQRPAELDAALRRLRYGTIGVNQWPGLGYALMSPPWGAFPGADLADVQSGIGFVHNTCLLDRPQKTVLRAPLTMFPKPSWFSTHRRPEALAWKLCDLYCQPSIWKLPGLFNQALRG